MMLVHSCCDGVQGATPANAEWSGPANPESFLGSIFFKYPGILEALAQPAILHQPRAHHEDAFQDRSWRGACMRCSYHSCDFALHSPKSEVFVLPNPDQLSHAKIGYSISSVRTFLCALT
jgi:hypothetical protein